MHSPCGSPVATASDTSPEMPLSAATASCQGFAGSRSYTPAARPLDRPNGQSALSSWLLCPAPPVAHQRAATALPRLRPGRSMFVAMPGPSFYSGPTPRLQHFDHLSDRGRAPATKPAAEALPALVMPSASWVTWLEGVIPRASGRMGGLPPVIVSASWPDRQIWPFRGSEYRSYPLPLDHRFSPLLGQIRSPKQRFRHRLPGHSPASPCGPFMVELFTAAGLARGPRTRSTSGSGCHQPGGSPRRHTLSGPAFAGRPEPRGRICSRFKTIEVFPHRPHSRSETLSDRTSGLL